jgi:hypothetical protein
MREFKDNKGKAMKIGVFVLAAGLVLPAAAAVAGQSSLAGDELRKAISGKTVYLNISGFELPIRQRSHVRQDEHGRRELLARRWLLRHRQMVGGRRPALPAMVELDGRQDLLLQAHVERNDRGVDQG